MISRTGLWNAAGVPSSCFSKIRSHITAVLVLQGCVCPTAWAAAFDNIAATAGVEFDHVTETVMPIGAGSGWADFDNDGDDDLYVTQATGCNKLFLNDGLGNFTEVADAAGASDCDSTSHGVAIADYDNDDDQDIFVTNRGQNHLFKNLYSENGSLDFTDATVEAGMDNDGGYASSSGSWGDYDNDGYLDLFVGNHAITGVPIVCSPDYLWHNNGDGSFTDVGADTGVALSGDLNTEGCALAVTWSDYDNDNDLDLMVINDFARFIFVPNRLFRNEGSGQGGVWSFTDVSASSGFDYPQAGMGIAIGDINRDGFFDYYMSDIGPNELALNNGDGTFTEIAASAGVEVADPEIYFGNLGLVSWGNGFFDLDNDGWEDLIVANGDAPESIWPGIFGEDYVDLNPNYVLKNHGNLTFTDFHESLGITVEAYNRGVAVSDIDNDGDIDIHFGNLHGFNSLYKNNIGSNKNWLKVKLRGTIGNHDAIGTRLKVRVGKIVQMREIDGGSSFMSRNSLTAHFGVGTATDVDRVVATFPSGLVYETRDIGVNQTVDITEPIVTAQLQGSTQTVVRGESIVANDVVTNHADTAQTIDLWTDLVFPDQSLVTVQGPKTVTLAANQAVNRSASIPTQLTSQLGSYLLIDRAGIYPDDIVHQTYMEVELIEQ